MFRTLVLFPVLLLYLLASAARVEAQGGAEQFRPLTRGEVLKLVELGIDERRIVFAIVIRGTRMTDEERTELEKSVPPRVALAIRKRGAGQSGPITRGEVEKLIDLGVADATLAELIEIRGSALDAEQVAEVSRRAGEKVRAVLAARLAPAAPGVAAGPGALPRFVPFDTIASGKRVRLEVPETYAPARHETEGRTTISLTPKSGAEEGLILGVTLFPMKGELEEARQKSYLLDIAKRQGLEVALDHEKKARFEAGFASGFATVSLLGRKRLPTSVDVLQRIVLVGIPGWVAVAGIQARADRFAEVDTLAHLSLQRLAIEGSPARWEWRNVRPAVLTPPPAPAAPLEGVWFRARWTGRELELETLAFTREGFVGNELPPAGEGLDAARVSGRDPTTVGVYASDGATITLGFPGDKTPTVLRRQGRDLGDAHSTPWRPAARDLGRVVLDGTFTSSSYVSISTPIYDGAGGQSVSSLSSKRQFTFTRDGRFSSSGGVFYSWAKDTVDQWGRATASANNPSQKGTYAISRGVLTLRAEDGSEQKHWLLLRGPELKDWLECFYVGHDCYLKDR